MFTSAGKLYVQTGQAVRLSWLKYWASCTQHMSTFAAFHSFAQDKAFSCKVIFNISSIAVGKLLLIGDHRKDWALCLMTAEHMHSSSFA